MANGKRGFGVFLASGCVTLCILGGLFLLYLMASRTVDAGQLQGNIPYEAPSSPTEEENLTLLVLGAREETSPLAFCTLFFYDAPKRTITQIHLSPALCVQGDSIAARYRSDGISGVTDAIASLLDDGIDRYAFLTAEGLANLTDFFGGIEATLPSERHIDGDTLLPGTQLLDGRRLSAILFSEESSFSERCEWLNRLTSRHLLAAIADDYTLFASCIFYNCRTDLSQYDFFVRQNGLLALCASEDALVSGMAAKQAEDLAQMHTQK